MLLDLSGYVVPDAVDKQAHRDAALRGVPEQRQKSQRHAIVADRKIRSVDLKSRPLNQIDSRLDRLLLVVQNPQHVAPTD
jgi:hypothetical protein